MVGSVNVVVTVGIFSVVWVVEVVGDVLNVARVVDTDTVVDDVVEVVVDVDVVSVDENVETVTDEVVSFTVDKVDFEVFLVIIVVLLVVELLGYSLGLNFSFRILM